MTDIETIAKRLTDGQRTAITEGYGCGVHKGMLAMKLWVQEFPDNNQYYLLTPLGQAVRDYLKGEKL